MDIDGYCRPTAYNFVVIIMTGVVFFQEVVDGYQGPTAYNFVVIIMTVCFSGGY